MASDEQVFKFLFGEEALDGVWFGTRKSGESAYWWRSHLREALAARDREIEGLRADAERLSAALGLVWTIHVRREVHLGYERWSGYEQDCIPCICALALGQGMDDSPTAEEFKARRAAIRARR